MKSRKIWLAMLAAVSVSMTACGNTQTSQTDSEPPVQAESEIASQEAVAEESAGQKSEGSETESPKKEEKETTTEENEVVPLRDCVPQVLGCRVGCAVTGSEIDDPKVWEIITTHFNAVTLGNELKPDALVGYSVGKVPGTTTSELNGETITVPKLDYSRAEKILNKILKWNEENPDRKIEVRGHVLVWHSQTPEWFFHEEYDKSKPYVDSETMNKRLEWYIREVLTHFTGEDSKYKDLFYGWDVVNEAISDRDGKLRTDAENSESLNEDRHGSNSSWYHIYQSNEFIINAFKYANKYAPADVELYYNDYNECTGMKRIGIGELLEAIKAEEGPAGEGTRIDAMGMQGHYGMTSPSLTEVDYAARFYGKIVGNVQFTEIDVSASDGYDGSAEKRDEENEKLRKRYNTLYYSMKTANKDEQCNITGITFWGTVDHYSWLQSRSNVGGGNTTGLPQMPLLFDENYEPKPCFFVFTNLNQ